MSIAIYNKSMEFSIIAWEAPEYYHTDKTADWFWTLGIITVTIVIVSLLLGNILFAIFVLIAALRAVFICW